MAVKKPAAVAKAIAEDRQAAYRKIWTITVFSGLTLLSVIAVMLAH